MVTIYIILTLMPTYLSSSPILIIVLMILIISLCFVTNPIIFSNSFLGLQQVTVMLAYSFLIFLLIFLIFGYGDIDFYYFYVYLRVFFAILLFYYYSNLNEKLQRWLSLISFLAMFIVSIFTSIALHKNPYSVRILTSGKQVDSFLTGGYSFIYGLLFYCIMILGLLNKNVIMTKTKKFAFCIILGFFIMVLYQSSLTISLILLIMSMFFLFIPSIRNGYSFYYWILLLFTLTVIFLNYADVIFYKLSIWTENFELSVRFLELSNFFSGNNVNGDMLTRLNLYSTSLQTFSNNPILGVGGYYGHDSILKGIGGHSELIDNFARYGIIVGLNYILIIISFSKYVAKRIVNNKLKKIYLVMVFVYILLGIVNNLRTVELGTIFFFTIPIYIYSIDQKNNKSIRAD